MGEMQEDFTLNYVYTLSPDSNERLDQAYDLILELILASAQIPEEDTVGVSANGSDAGEIIHSSPLEKSMSLGAIHAR